MDKVTQKGVWVHLGSLIGRFPEGSLEKQRRRDSVRREYIRGRVNTWAGGFVGQGDLRCSVGKAGGPAELSEVPEGDLSPEHSEFTLSPKEGGVRALDGCLPFGDNYSGLGETTVKC